MNSMIYFLSVWKLSWKATDSEICPAETVSPNFFVPTLLNSLLQWPYIAQESLECQMDIIFLRWREEYYNLPSQVSIILIFLHCFTLRALPWKVSRFGSFSTYLTILNFPDCLTFFIKGCKNLQSVSLCYFLLVLFTKF